MSLIKRTATLVIILAIFSLNKISARHTAAPVDQKNSCICYTLYDPVCGTDGVTYQNDCTLNCAKRSSCGEIQKDYKGECSKGCNSGHYA